MKPKFILFLCAIGFSLQGLIPWMAHQSRPVPILSILFVLLAFGILSKRKAAFRTFQAATWIIFILSLLAGLTVMFSRDAHFSFFDELITKSSDAGKIAYCALWCVVLGALLYYMESDKVRKEYGLPEKRRYDQEPPQ